MMNGEIPEVLLIDKPAGMSSFSVVARVRGVLSRKLGRRIKVGHAGTLDPFATGLLLILIDKGTKKATEFLKLDKRYQATIRLGATSTTGDIEGEISNFKQDIHPPKHKQIEEVLRQFTGEIEQKVPAYSAVKINGQRAYVLARRGEDVETPMRKVQIYELKLIEYQWPELMIDCKVSSGTYIRTLGEDIGKALGVGGYLTELRRTEVGEFKIDEAVGLEEWTGRMQDA